MKFIFKIAIVIFIVIFILLNALVFIISYNVLNIISNGKTIFSVGIFESDLEYGIKGKINAEGFIVFPGGDSIEVKLNEFGERISKDTSKYNLIDDSSKKILFIGDSYTFGDGNHYEETFPYLISNSLGLQLKNASMVGYGYVQYLKKLEEALMHEDFDVIAIQLSPHSIERSINGYLPAFSRIPTPFFCYDLHGNIITHNAKYKTNLFELTLKGNLSKYLDKKYTLKNYLDFSYNIIYPLYFNQFAMEILDVFKTNNYKRVLTLVEVENHFINSLNKILLGKENEVIFYNIGYDPNEFDDLSKRMNDQLNFKPIYVNFEYELWKYVDDIDQYFSKFGHWRGDPPVLVDRHYNREAHKIVSEQFVKKNLEVMD